MDRKSVRSFTEQEIPEDIVQVILEASTQAPTAGNQQFVVHENSYHELSAKELQDMLSSHAGGQDYQTWMKAFCERKYNSDFSREMSRSVRKYLEDFAR
jgi:nitroreductase